MDKEVEDDGLLDALKADEGDVGGVQTDGKLGGLEEKVEQEPQSARDSIKKAFKEVEDEKRIIAGDDRPYFGRMRHGFRP